MTKEIKALLELIDDSDHEVASPVQQKLETYGEAIIPDLLKFNRIKNDAKVQTVLDNLIHKLNCEGFQREFEKWKSNPESLLEGALLIAKINNPYIDVDDFYWIYGSIKKSIKRELKKSFTPLEIMTAITAVLYRDLKFTANEVDFDNADELMVDKVLDSKWGNSISFGVIISAICADLNIPLCPVDIPGQNILGFFRAKNLEEIDNDSDGVLYFYDPANSLVYRPKDVLDYLTRCELSPKNSYFQKVDNLRVIKALVETFCQCYDGEKNDMILSKIKKLKAITA